LYTEGRNQFQLAGRATPSQPGTLVLTDPGRPHDFGPLVRGRTSYHEMTFTFDHSSGPLMVSFPQLLGLYAGVDFEPFHLPLVLTPKQLNTMTGLFRDLLRRIEQAGAEGWFEVYRVIWNMLSFIMMELLVPAESPESADAGPLVEVKSYLDQYYGTAIDLGDLARRAHYSEAHLCRSFRKAYGLSPIAYQQTLRVAAARNLLTSTNHQCKEIARTLGYADGYAFSKAFKKITGTSPNHYRKAAGG
jgi:AraC-like DNA-binding protein